MKVTIYNSQSFNKQNLKNIYDVCNKIFNQEECFYTNGELKELKRDKTNIFFDI